MVSDDPYSEDEAIEEEEEEPECQGMPKSGTLMVVARAKPHHAPAGGAIIATKRITATGGTVEASQKTTAGPLC